MPPAEIKRILTFFSGRTNGQAALLREVVFTTATELHVDFNRDSNTFSFDD